MSSVKLFFKDAALEDIISISMLEPLGPISLQRIYRRFPSLRSFLKASHSQLANAGLTDLQINAVIDRPQQVDAAFRLLKSKDIKVITIDNPNYPPLLKEISDPPLWLFFRGNLKALNRPTLTVVGTRKPSAYAISALEQILAEALIRKVCLVSGLAYGVDKKVHQLALKYDSPTVAILAGGLDSIYPSDHSRLADSIVEKGGLLISEYPPLSRPRPAKFPIRNRIIAGLSSISIVVEAKIKSGSLTTAKAALDYNRDVYAIPSDINRRSSGGTNFLIKQGAILLDDSQQLFDALGISTKNANKAQIIDKTEQKLLNLLESQELTVDQLSTLTKLEIPEILGILTHLELLGAVYQKKPGFYEARK